MSISDTPGFRLTITTCDCIKLWPVLNLYTDLCELGRVGRRGTDHQECGKISTDLWNNQHRDFLKLSGRGRGYPGAATLKQELISHLFNTEM